MLDWIPMTFSFRIRFNLPPGERLAVDESSLLISEDSTGRVELLPCDGKTPIRDTDDFAIRGNGYPDEASAESAADKWSRRVRAVFAANHTAADFGYRAPQGFVTEHGLEQMRSRVSVPVLNDIHGTMIYRTYPRPILARVGGAFGTVHRNADRLLRSFSLASTLDLESTPASIVAFDLYGASYFDSNADSKLVLLVTAVETLADRDLRAPEVLDAVDRMIAEVKSLPVEARIRDSLRGGLRDLRYESIAQACGRLAARLGDVKYQDEPPVQFFSRCYTMRSHLVHGALPRPDLNDVRQRAGNLQRFVADILAGPELRTMIRSEFA
jgi:hypothetical protein